MRRRLFWNKYMYGSGVQAKWDAVSRESRHAMTSNRMLRTHSFLHLVQSQPRSTNSQVIYIFELVRWKLPQHINGSLLLSFLQPAQTLVTHKWILLDFSDRRHQKLLNFPTHPHSKLSICCFPKLEHQAWEEWRK